MARIGIDCRFASHSVGLGTYTRNIVTNLLQADSHHEFILFVSDQNENWITNIHSSNFELRTLHFPHYSFSEQIRFPNIIRASTIDLLYAPHFNVPYFCPVPFIVTVHDLILHKYPNKANALKWFAYRLIIDRAISKSQHTIAVSEFTKGEIESVYGSPASAKTTVVTEGFDDNFCKTDDADILNFYDLTPGYFLYVGTSKQHKNVQKLIDAHAMSGTASPLIIVTNGKEVDSLQICDNTRILLGVDTDELPALYSAAACFVTASEYEGFCLPIVEARACGCPVIARNASAIPEVAGEHALLIDGSDASLIMAFRNPPKQSDPPEGRFDWKKSANEISGILTDIAHG